MVNFRKENYFLRRIKRYSLLTFFGLTFVISLTGFILDIPELWVFEPSAAGVIQVQRNLAGAALPCLLPTKDGAPFALVW
jgi:hypothetical protein